MDAELANAIMSRRSLPTVTGPEPYEGYTFSDLEIRIKESTDLYGAVLWPSVSPRLSVAQVTSCCESSSQSRVSVQAMVLCHFLETNRDKYNLIDKNVIELGAGTGLVSIVSSLLGAK